MRKYSQNYVSFFDINEASEENRELTYLDFINNYNDFFRRHVLGQTYEKYLAENMWAGKTLFDWMMENKNCFHNPVHVLSIFQFYDGLPFPKLKMTDALEAAIWFHDSFYRAGNKSNEEESCVRLDMVDNINPFIGQSFINEAKDIILDTKNHCGDDVSESSYMMLDLDIHYFGLDYSILKKINDCIRKEFSHLTDEQWKNGRVDFLSKMAEKEHLYRTEYFRNVLEKDAKTNLARLISEIQRS